MVKYETCLTFWQYMGVSMDGYWVWLHVGMEGGGEGSQRGKERVIKRFNMSLKQPNTTNPGPPDSNQLAL